MPGDSRGGGLTITGTIPEGVDTDRLAVTFALDGEPLTFGWVDMQTAPVVGDMVKLSAIGMDEDDFGVVFGRQWQEHNWLIVHITRRTKKAPDV